MKQENPLHFPDTNLPLVKNALKVGTPASQKAHYDLYHLYEPPIKAWLRARVFDPQEVEDLKLTFFAKFIHRQGFDAALNTDTRLRTIILARLRTHFIDYLRARKRRQKREVSLDELTPRELSGVAMVDHRSPDKEFHNQWRRTMLEMAVDQVRQRRLRQGMSLQEFQAVLDCVLENNLDSQKDLGAKVGFSPEKMKQLVFRIRHSIGEELRRIVADTIGKPTNDEIEAELKELEKHR